MIRSRKSTGLIALVIALLAVLSTLLGTSHQALAAGAHTVTQWDDFSGAEGANGGSIAGATYAKASLLAFSGSYVTLFTHKYPGYAALTVAVGVADGAADNHPGTVTVSAMVDGRTFKTMTKTYGQAATQLTVPFGQASQIKLSMHDNQKQGLYILLGSPTVVASLPKAVATPQAFGSGSGNGSSSSHAAGSGKTILKLFSASVASGSQETALITTAPNATLTLVIAYPSGSQLVLGPKKAAADGNFAYSWMVPSGVAGIVHVVVVSSSVAQATFTIQ